jgi:hypothetical protein
MEEDRIPKKIFSQELEGLRRRGRPRKGWEEEVERDLQVLGVRRWRELVTDRKKWKEIVRHAKAHYGLYSQWKKSYTTTRYQQQIFQPIRKAILLLYLILNIQNITSEFYLNTIFYIELPRIF